MWLPCGRSRHAASPSCFLYIRRKLTAEEYVSWWTPLKGFEARCRWTHDERLSATRRRGRRACWRSCMRSAALSTLPRRCMKHSRCAPVAAETARQSPWRPACSPCRTPCFRCALHFPRHFICCKSYYSHQNRTCPAADLSREVLWVAIDARVTTSWRFRAAFTLTWRSPLRPVTVTSRIDH